VSAGVRRALRVLFGRSRPGSGALGGDEHDPSAAPPEHRAIVERTLPHTMTSVARLSALIEAVHYCVRRELPGAFAECGVWRGGSVLAMVLSLQELGAEPRHIWLYDTFEGMTAPTERDGGAMEEWRRTGGRPWPEVFGPDAYDEDSVRELVLSTGYPEERLHIVRGPVERTIPAQAPQQLSLLRLDTDWYDSTRHELEHLYPRLLTGGVLIIDDYGHWEGARRAVDEYFASQALPVLLNSIDYTGRIAVKA
jgi:O-methyltransferase